MSQKTKQIKQKIEREYRGFNLNFREAGEENSEKIVEGVACVFDVPTVIFNFDGIDYYEVIDRDAFKDADLSDVIFNYNHSGKVMARLRNNTLTLEEGTDGLHIRADLSGTKAGQELFEEIKGGYVDRMSFAFSIAEESYDVSTRTRKILKIKKLYDVSAVDIPAYDTTLISARNAFLEEHEKVALEQAANEEKRKKLLLETEITLLINGGERNE